MKLLICDFDGTLYRNCEISDEDIEAIVHWQQKGNKFVFATGRDWVSLKKKLEAYPNVRADYIIGNNGATIDTRSFNTLDQSKAKKLLKRVVNELNEIENIKLSIKDVTTKQWDSLKFTTISQANEGITDEGPFELYQMAFQFPTALAAKDFIKKFEKDFKTFSFIQNVSTVDVAPVNTDKASAVDILARELSVDHEAIYTIGDGLNDRRMLRDYTSATFPDVLPSVEDSAEYQVSSVAKWIEEILENS